MCRKSLPILMSARLISRRLDLRLFTEPFSGLLGERLGAPIDSRWNPHYTEPLNQLYTEPGQHMADKATTKGT